MNLKGPRTCPVCGGEYETTKLSCKKCHCELSGHFSGCEFCVLDEAQAHFVLAFLKCGGNIKEVEKELKISYPTVKNRLNNVISKLGLKERKTQTTIKDERMDVFDRLNNGEINADEAAQLLKSI